MTSLEYIIYHYNYVGAILTGLLVVNNHHWSKVAEWERNLEKAKLKSQSGQA